VLAVLQENHLLALDLNTEAVVCDEVQDRKEIDLQRGDIQESAGSSTTESTLSLQRG
jgi:hypothetical protein